MLRSFCRIVLLSVFSMLLQQAAKAQSFAWAQAVVGNSTSASRTSVITGTTDTAGNLYTIGGFGGTADFDRGIGIYNLTAVSDIDMFIMKEDSSGNLIWVKQVKGLSSGTSSCFGNAINVDAQGNVFITGFFNESFDFDPGPTVYTLDAPWGDDTFILKLDASGNFVWARTITA